MKRLKILLSLVLIFTITLTMYTPVHGLAPDVGHEAEMTVLKGNSFPAFGDTVVFGGREWICMGTDPYYRLMLKGLVKDESGIINMPFDDDSVLFVGSEMEAYLNGEFLNSLGADSSDMVAAVPWDVGYDIYQDRDAEREDDIRTEPTKVGLMTYYEHDELFSKNRNFFINNFDDISEWYNYWWLITPFSDVEGTLACSDGTWTAAWNDYDDPIAIRPVLNLKEGVTFTLEDSKYFVNLPAASDNASLLSAAQKTDTTPEGGSGTSAEEAIVWTVDVDYLKENFVLSDISAAQFSTKHLYSDASFNTEVLEENSIALIAGAATPIYIKVIAEDGSTVRYYAVTINRAQRPDNLPPVLNGIGDRTVKAGDTITIELSANDPDPGAALTYDYYSYTWRLRGIYSIDTNSGVFSWMTMESDRGTYKFEFSVSDGTFTDSEDINITILDPSKIGPPVLDTIGDKSIDVGTELNFVVSATDPDNDSLTFSADRLPPGASFDVTTREFSWTPGNLQIGDYTVKFIVSDGNQTDDETITITVNDINHPPVLSNIGNKTVAEGVPLNFSISATDEDSNDTLTYSVAAVSPATLPTGASFDTSTRTFSWTPTNAQIGTYTLRFAVDDQNGGNDYVDVIITVTKKADTQQPTNPNTSGGPGGFVGFIPQLEEQKTVPQTITGSKTETGYGFKVTPSVDEGIARTSLDKQQIDYAFSQAIPDNNNTRTVTLNIAEMPDTKTYMQEFAVSVLSTEDSSRLIEINTPVAGITIQGDMFSPDDVENKQKIGISVSLADKSKLTGDIAGKIGSRPLIELSAYLDGKLTEWSNANSPVTISIDYKPTQDELKNPDQIVVWYIDGNGKIVEVPSGHYDPVSGKVIFSTSHFSLYAIAYDTRTYSDIEKAYAKDSIEALASRGLYNWIKGDKFGPDRNITRGEFIYLLVNVLELHSPVKNNFSDVSASDFYYEAASIAKELGITNGMGNNRFGGGMSITRQDMSTLIVRALKAAGKSYPDGSAADLNSFIDAGNISGYAKDSLATLVKAGVLVGYNNSLEPKGTFTMQQAATVIHRIYKKAYMQTE